MGRTQKVAITEKLFNILTGKIIKSKSVSDKKSLMAEEEPPILAQQLQGEMVRQISLKMKSTLNEFEGENLFHKIFFF